LTLAKRLIACPKDHEVNLIWTRSVWRRNVSAQELYQRITPGKLLY